MRIAHLYAENFKRLSVVEISPTGDIVEIAGKNGQGKSSILDAIWVALAGRAVAPPKPVRKGVEKCVIRLDLGDMIITRTFSEKESGPYTDTVKVETSDGLRYPKPQEVLDGLMGQLGFDPFAFIQMKPDEQAETLMQLVPLSVDIEKSALADQSDYAKRRDINRDIAALDGQIAGIPDDPDLPKEAPDRGDLADQLAKAADHNTAIERILRQREQEDCEVVDLGEEIASLESKIEALKKRRANIEQAIKEREPLGASIDVDAIRQLLREADGLAARMDAQKRRADLVEQRAKAKRESDALTDAMRARDEERQKALAEAKMPVEGLSFGISDKGKPVILFDGVPFEQASSAAQIRVATAVAMASNPELRVLRIKDGALLDDDSMAILREMAADEDFQLWVEVVRPTEGVGFIIENGQVAVEPAQKKPSKKASEKPDGAMI